MSDRMAEIHKKIDSIHKELTDIWVLACQKDKPVPNLEEEERLRDLQA